MDGPQRNFLADFEMQEVAQELLQNQGLPLSKENLSRAMAAISSDPNVARSTVTGNDIYEREVTTGDLPPADRYVTQDADPKYAQGLNLTGEASPAMGSVGAGGAAGTGGVPVDPALEAFGGAGASVSAPPPGDQLAAMMAEVSGDAGAGAAPMAPPMQGQGAGNGMPQQPMPIDPSAGLAGAEMGPGAGGPAGTDDNGILEAIAIAGGGLGAANLAAGNMGNRNGPPGAASPASPGSGMQSSNVLEGQHIPASQAAPPGLPAPGPAALPPGGSGPALTNAQQVAQVNGPPTQLSNTSGAPGGGPVIPGLGDPGPDKMGSWIDNLLNQMGYGNDAAPTAPKAAEAMPSLDTISKATQLPTDAPAPSGNAALIAAAQGSAASQQNPGLELTGGDPTEGVKNIEAGKLPKGLSDEDVHKSMQRSLAKVVGRDDLVISTNKAGDFEVIGPNGKVVSTYSDLHAMLNDKAALADVAKSGSGGGKGKAAARGARAAAQALR